MQPELFETINRAFEPWREIYRRDAWKPIISQQAAFVSTSKFGGIPLLSRRETWPKCGTCRRPLQLFLQLDLTSLPKQSSGPQLKGLLQLFYCASDCDAPLWEPFSNGVLVRIREPQVEDFSDSVIPPDFEPFPARHIISWAQFDDYPSGMEHDRCGLQFDYDFTPSEVITTVRWPERNIVFDRVVEPRTVYTTVNSTADKTNFEQVTASPDDSRMEKVFGNCNLGDKLAGWPCWIQNVEYPSCPKCGTEMDYLFQIDSEDNVPYMFGDVGCGHITQCPNHPDVLAFAWACS